MAVLAGADKLVRPVENAKLLASVLHASVMDIVTKRKLNLTRIEGEHTDGLGPISAVFCGDVSNYRNWIHALFGRPLEGAELGNQSLLAVLLRTGPLRPADLVLCPVNPLTQWAFRLAGWHIVPRYVECIVDLAEGGDGILSTRAVKKELSYFRKFNYRFTVKRESKDYEHFYHQMLVPTVRSRHEDRAYVSSLDDLLSQGARGYLLALHADDEWIAADFVLEESPADLRWATVGWLHGEEKYLKAGVVSAMLYELLKESRSQGYARLNLGSCNPFVGDGPLNYKLKWGAQVHPPRLEMSHGVLSGIHSYLAVYVNPRGSAGVDLVQRCRFYVKRGNSLALVSEAQDTVAR
jgi:hypothetical protein